jgi:hypothetical protein
MGTTFAADVLKCNRQLILVLRETVSSYTSACLVASEQAESLRDGLVQLCVPMIPLDGPPAVVRVDPGPGFNSLRNDKLLASLRIRVEVGERKNKNKNPVAEKAVQELEDELLRQNPDRTSVTQAELTVTVSTLNSRIRNQGLSSREIWTQRDQFTHDQLPLNDEQYIQQQHRNRQRDHVFDPKTFKHAEVIGEGDLVYLYADKDKTHARPRYLVSSVDSEWCFLRKFVGNQLRQHAYKVHKNDCFKIPTTVHSRSPSDVGRLTKSSEVILQPFGEDNVDVNLGPAAPPVPAEITEPLQPDFGSLESGAQVQPPPAEPPVPTGEIASLDEPDDPHEHDGVAMPTPPALPSSRPPRARRPPKYLQDYER